MGATLLLHALLGASGASRLSQSRITSYFQPFEQGPLSADALQRLRGGATAGTCDVVLVGCGVPKRGMGWYHAKQMLDGDTPYQMFWPACHMASVLSISARVGTTPSNGTERRVSTSHTHVSPGPRWLCAACCLRSRWQPSRRWAWLHCSGLLGCS